MATKTEEVVKTSKIVGKTLPEFNGVSVPTLRAWAKYWGTPARCGEDPALKGDRNTPEAHLQLIAAELEARGKQL